MEYSEQLARVIFEAVTSAIRRASTSAANEREQNNEVGIFQFYRERQEVTWHALALNFTVHVLREEVLLHVSQSE